MVEAQPAPQGLSYQATCITPFIGIRVQVVCGKKGEVNPLISYPLGSFSHTGEGEVPLWDAGRGL